MKQRRKAILALLLSASVAASPIVSATSVFAEDLDFATVEETEVTSEDAGSDFSDDSISIEDSDDVTEADTADDSILIDNSDSAEYSESDTDVFSAGDEVDAFTAADEVSVQADEEAKTHSIKVTVVNSSGVSGMYAMDNAIITKQDDGTYLVKMHQKSNNRNYMALTRDVTAATQHRVDWYVADTDYYYTIPVANLTEPVYASFSYTKNVNKGAAWSNVQTITFDTSSMADTTEPAVDASGMNKQAALNYTAADAALASVPEDLSIYTDETAKAVTDAANALKGKYKAIQQSDVDTLVTALTDAVKALRKKAVSLTVTNKTAMFNVTDAVLDNDKLIVTLHGTGYHYLYKGTYEEAVENGDNRDKWIAGDNSSGKWQFTIPVAEGETFVPIVAISHSYLTKYEQGKNSLERAFYPRQAVIDQNAATLVTGDYDHTKNLTVTNNVKMFKVDTASLETIGGPNSNNYKEILHLTMGSTSFDKVFIGSAVDAAAAETTTDITDQKADLTVKANAMGGEATVDYLEKEVIFSFHSVKNDSWYERVFNVNKTNGTLTITPVSVPATSITLNASSQNLITGESFTLTATVEPAKTTDTVVWSSSNEAVATVSDGTVTAAKAGTTEITATAGNVKATCTVTVSDPVYKVTDIKLTAAPSRRIAAGKKVKLKASIAPSNATDKSVTWTSSNKKVATVNAKGLVTFKKNAGGKKSNYHSYSQRWK